MRIKRLLIWITGVMMAFPLMAQDDYLLEVGANAGVGYYMGDLNEWSFYHKVRESYGALFRYNHNFRSAFKFTFTMGRLSGDTQTSNQFPDPLKGGSFTTHLYDLGAMYEFNFFHYSDRYAYLGTKRLTPYISAGIGATVASGTGGTTVAPIIPFGVGLKYKLKQRINIGCEISFRWALSDKIDGTGWKDPYGIESSGLKNNDWYSFTHFFISYSFHQRRKVCNSLID